MNKLYLCILVFLFPLVTFYSCERRELTYYDYPFCGVSILVDWKHAFPATEKPLGMSVWSYPRSGGAPVRNISNNVDFVNIHLPEGIYDIVVFNKTPAEFGTIGFRNTDKLESLQVYAVKESAQEWYTSDECHNQYILRQPNKFAVAIYRDLEIKEEMIEETRLNCSRDTTKSNDHSQSKVGINPSFQIDSLKGTRSLIKVYPCRVTLDAKIFICVEGIQNLRSVRAAVTNMAEGREINKERTNIIPATHLVTEFSQQGDTGNGIITMSYTTFGLVGDPDNPCYTFENYDYWKGKLYLEVLLVDNKTIKEFNFNLDSSLVDIIEKKQEPGSPLKELELYINAKLDKDKIPPIILPDVKPEEGTGSVFDATVEPWDDEDDIEIPIG